MKEKISQWLRLDELSEHLIGYAEARVELAKNRMQEKAGLIVANLGIAFMLLTAFTVLCCFLLLTLGLFIGQALDNTALGFLILSGIIAFITFAIYGFRHKISNFIVDKTFSQVISEPTNEKSHDE